MVRSPVKPLTTRLGYESKCRLLRLNDFLCVIHPSRYSVTEGRVRFRVPKEGWKAPWVSLLLFLLLFPSFVEKWKPED